MDMSSAPLDFTVVCRLCLKSGDSKKICEMPYYMVILHKFTNITVHDNDGLSKNICNECCVKLDDISQFIEMCNENNSYVNALHTSTIIKQEYTDYGYLKDPKTELIDDENEDQNIYDANKDYNITKEECLDMYPDPSLHDNDTNDNEFNVTECTLCSWIGEDLKEHEMEHISPSGTWKCVDCEKTYDKKYDLKHHRHVHTGEKLYKCEICGMSFTQINSKKRHLIAIHPTEMEELKFECYICGQTAKRKDSLEKHMLGIHIKNQAKVWNDKLGSGCICTICGKSFSLPSYLEHHSLMHEGRKQKRIRRKSVKIKVTVPKSKFQCACGICGKSFTKENTYSKHMRMKHSNAPAADDKKETYQCWQCGKIFNVLSNMKRHIRVHTGEKPYKCKFCERKFAQLNTWRDHENIHTGIKPHKCNHCHKSFTQRTALVTHMKSAIHRKVI